MENKNTAVAFHKVSGGLSSQSLDRVDVSLLARLGSDSYSEVFRAETNMATPIDGPA